MKPTKLIIALSTLAAIAMAAPVFAQSMDSPPHHRANEMSRGAADMGHGSPSPGEHMAGGDHMGDGNGARGRTGQNHGQGMDGSKPHDPGMMSGSGHMSGNAGPGDQHMQQGMRR